jgi:hypothetical protein
MSLAALDLGSYAHFVSVAGGRKIEQHARRVQGLRVLHVCADPPDPATRHLLDWLVPLSRAAGLTCEWRVTPQMYDGVAAVLRQLLSVTAAMPPPLCEDVIDVNRRVAEIALDGEWDVIVAHDAELVFLPALAEPSSARWLFRPGAINPDATFDGLTDFDGVIWDDEGVTGRDVNVPSWTMRPAVDPLAPRSRTLSKEATAVLCEGVGLEPQRPLVVAPARFSGLGGIVDAIDCYWAAKESIPDLQFALIEPMTMRIADRTWADCLAARAAEDPDIHVLAGLTEVEANAVCSAASLVVQTSHSIRSDLDVVEAWWKRRPVVRRLPRRGGAIPGPALRARNLDEVAMFMHALLADRIRAAQVGHAGQSFVSERMLAPSALGTWLGILAAVTGR